MKKLFTLMFALATLLVQAQFITPGTGVVWNLDSLVNNSAGVVTWNDNHYEITNTVTIAAADALNILEDVTVVFHDLAGIESEGTIIIDAPVKATFTAIDSTSTNKWRGFKLVAGHVTHIRNAEFLFGGGIRSQTGIFTVEGSKFYKNFYKSGSTSGSYASSAAVDLSGYGEVINCSFILNQRGAVASGSNVGTKAIIRNNYMFGNTTENSNRPQINMGPAGEGDTTYIIGNTVIGNGYVQAGGIAYSSLLAVPGSVVIDSNIVDKNRYGITLTGSPITGAIRYNTITDNNIQNNPNLGGSGINLTASNSSSNQVAMITGNIISGNLWGITIVGYPRANMGNSDPANFNPGGNQFANNGNGGVLYDLYNNGPVEQYAMYNQWGVATQDSASIEGVVNHVVDDPALGRVNFMPAYQFQTYFTVESESGEPLAGVEISIEGIAESLLTDAQGGAFTMLSPGNYNYTAVAEGYAVNNGTFEAGTSTTEVSIVMNLPRYLLSFYIYDEALAPVEGASIDVDGNVLLTAANGTAAIELSNGIYPYAVSKEGYFPVNGEALIEDGNSELAIQLNSTSAPTYTLSFLVTDPDTTPLEAALIEITGQQSLTTGADGTASVNLPDGDYAYTVSLEGYVSGSGSVTISGAGEEVNLVLELVAPETWMLTFMVSAQAGVLEGVEININGTLLITNEQGIAQIELSDGAYPYTASAPGFDFYEGTVTIAGADAEEVIFMTTGLKNGPVAGLRVYPNPVTDRLYIDGASLAEATLYAPDGRQLMQQQLSGNTMDLGNLRSGTYLLRIVSGGNASVMVIVKQ